MQCQDQHRCSLCGAPDPRFLFTDFDRFYNIRNPAGPGANSFSLYQCRQCSLVFLFPRPDAGVLDQHERAESIQPDLYHELKQGMRTVNFRRRCLITLKHDLKLITCRGQLGYIRGARGYALRFLTFPFRSLVIQYPAWQPGEKRILDIGCGSGGWLKLAQELGWDAYGIDTDRLRIEYGKSVLKLKLSHGKLEDCQFAPGSFDVITVWHVIEHVPDPKRLLNIIGLLLKPGGEIRITTPNHRSLARMLFRRNWIGYYLPRHNYIFTAETLARVLNEAGFSITHAHFTDQLNNFIYSLDLGLRYADIPILLKRCLRNRVFWLAARFLFRSIMVILPWFGLSSILYVKARKRGHDD